MLKLLAAAKFYLVNSKKALQGGQTQAELFFINEVIMKQKTIQSQTTPILYRPPTAEEQRVPRLARIKANAIAFAKMIGFAFLGFSFWFVCGAVAAKIAAKYATGA